MSGFQLKDHASITASIINQLRASQDKLTDFEVGSVVRTLSEANATEIEELYQKVFAGIMDAIPTSIYKTFDFEVVGPAAARGTVLATFGTAIEAPFTVPAGTIFTTASSVRFTSVASIDVPAGATSCLVVVVATAEGAVGNVGANAILGTEGFSFPIGTTLANNAFSSGNDGQTEAERKARFAEFITSLSRSTPAAIRRAARQVRLTNEAGLLVEYVSRVGLDERPGLVIVYLYGSDGLPSPALMELAQREIDGYSSDSASTDGYRALGVEMRVRAMSERAVPVELRIELMDGVEGTPALRNMIATELAGVFDATESGDTLYVNQLTGAALALTGVRKVTAANNENIVCGSSEVLTLGQFDVKWGSDD